MCFLVGPKTPRVMDGGVAGRDKQEEYSKERSREGYKKTGKRKEGVEFLRKYSGHREDKRPVNWGRNILRPNNGKEPGRRRKKKKFWWFGEDQRGRQRIEKTVRWKKKNREAGVSVGIDAGMISLVTEERGNAMVEKERQ